MFKIQVSSSMFKFQFTKNVDFLKCQPKCGFQVLIYQNVGFKIDVQVSMFKFEVLK